MTQVYYASISKESHGFLMNKYRTEFSKSFSRKLGRYRRWEDAQLSLLGRLLVKHGFEKNNKSFVEKDIIFSEHNKPMLKNQPFQFNISHSGGLAVCVITDVAEVGVDIELMKEVDVEEFKFQMTKKEWLQLVTADSKDDAFYDYWTQKEAILKASSKGLSIPLDSFEVEYNNSKINGDFFYIKRINVENNYKCHVAFKNEFDQNCLIPQKVMFE